MINFDDYTNENRTEHNENWPYIPNKPYRILIIGGSGSGQTNILNLIKNINRILNLLNKLLNLIEKQPDFDEIYLYAKDPYEAKYQYLINKREGVGIDHFK